MCVPPYHSHAVVERVEEVLPQPLQRRLFIDADVAVGDHDGLQKQVFFFPDSERLQTTSQVQAL